MEIVIEQLDPTPVVSDPPELIPSEGTLDRRRQNLSRRTPVRAMGRHAWDLVARELANHLGDQGPEPVHVLRRRSRLTNRDPDERRFVKR